MDVQAGIVLIQTEEGTVELPAIELILSERNLKTLLLSIDDEDNSVSRFTESGFLLVIRAEKNEVHYADRAAGLMDASVEEKLIAEELGDGETLYLPPEFGTKLDD